MHTPRLQAVPAVVLIATLCAGPAAGATRLVGKIKVTDSKGTRVTAAELTTQDGTVYALQMDTPGEDLARVMFNQKVDILADITESAGHPHARVVAFSEDKFTEAHELWRRSRCNACAVQKAAQFAPEPRDLQGAVAIRGRLHPFKQQVRDTARDSRFLWVVTDSLLYQLDMDAHTQVTSYDAASGLPNSGLLEVASDGTTVWILAHGQAAALTIANGILRPLPLPPFRFARLHITDKAATVIADTGTYTFRDAAQPPQTHPAIPTATRLSAEVERGMWLAMWKRNTDAYLSDPVTVGDRLYVGSFGNIYELAHGQWKIAIPGGFDHLEADGKLWALTAKGVSVYDPQSGKTDTRLPSELGDARLTSLCAGAGGLWVTAEPHAKAGEGGPASGGIARMDLASGQTRTWNRLNDFDAGHARVEILGDSVWAVTHEGTYRTLAAHPGMTYVKKDLFTATGFAVHRWDSQAATWQSDALPPAALGSRYICGQDGAGDDGTIVPQTIDKLCAATDRLFAATRLYAEGMFSGYWPCVNEIGRTRDDGTWDMSFRHDPEALNLQGEQPRVLNISNKGEMVLEAVGHDNILDLFERNGTAWAVTEQCVAFFDAATGEWSKLLTLGFDFYWRVTALLDEGAKIYVGCDRGLVSCLDRPSGRWSLVGGLKDRQIESIARNGTVLAVTGGQAPLGELPFSLRTIDGLIDADCATWDDHTWKRVEKTATAPPEPERGWDFRPMKQASNRRMVFQREQFIGNMLWGPGPQGGDPVPRYYVKDVYVPRFLGFSGDGQRLWLSTYTGLLMVNPPSAESAN